MSDPVIHKIGGARTIQTAVLVCEYLRDRCANPHSPIHRDSITYHFVEPSEKNGFWSADILVTTYNYNEKTNAALTKMVDTCRDFVAGRGEIWA